MNTALVRSELNNEQVALVKRMIAKDATPDELALFLGQCNRTGLDPFSKQIYAISRWSKADGRKVMAIQVSIDGARLIAERTGKYDNQEGPYWCGEDGQWVDVWLDKAPPRAAKVLVYKTGSSRATTGIAHWDEYADATSPFWKTKPALMLAKCAESLALRKAFPQELSGLYTAEEMSQADSVVDTTYTVAEHAPRLSTSPENDVSFEQEPDTKPRASDEQKAQLYGLVKEFYGPDEWEDQMIKLTKAVSKGATDNPDNLLAVEVARLIDGVTKKMAGVKVAA
jgi:phage recombination protein Bet